MNNAHIEDRVFDYLLGIEKATRMDIVRGTGLTVNQVRRALNRLKLKGCIELGEMGRKEGWRACADEVPEGYVERKSGGVHPPVPMPATMLEKCWGWFGTFQLDTEEA